MAERITIHQIEQQYEPGWVILDEVEMNEEKSFIKSGVLLFHSVNKSECFQKLVSFQKSNLAFKFIGKANENVTYLL